MKQYGHGARGGVNLFSRNYLKKCNDRFGYMFPGLSKKKKCVIPCNDKNHSDMEVLGNIIGNKPSNNDNELIPAGYTYLGQFIDHDITLDPFSTFDCGQNLNEITNFRTPNLDLDSVYGNGPAVDPFLYNHNTGNDDTNGIKLLLGKNRDTGSGGPFSGVPTDFDLPRTSDQTAIIGDPRNNENLIVSQLHHSFLKFHNAVVDHLLNTVPVNQLFEEARKTVSHHYQWIVFHDFLKRITNPTLVDNVLNNGNRYFRRRPFQMPVEFSVAAYRFGHSMIRQNYAVNDNFPNATLSEVFKFVRLPQLPVFSNWVVDFNRFFETGSAKPVQPSKKIDTSLSPFLNQLPDEMPPIFSVLAVRNLKRALAFGLPSGQCVARRVRVSKLTNEELLSNTTPEESGILHKNDDQMLKKTPLWYYVLKEAEVKENGERLGSLGAIIVVETLCRILHDDPNSFIHVSGGFSPSLPSTNQGQFDMPDLLRFAGVI